MKIKLGIVGTNFISDRLYEAASNVSEVEIGAVYSRHQETDLLKSMELKMFTRIMERLPSQ